MFDFVRLHCFWITTGIDVIHRDRPTGEQVLEYVEWRGGDINIDANCELNFRQLRCSDEQIQIATEVRD